MAHAFGEAPRVATERLLLRAPERADFGAYAAMWRDAEVVRHITGEPLARETAWAKFLRDAGHWALAGYGFWSVTEAQSGRYVGVVGFADFMRDVEPALGDGPEMGWALVGAAHGRGYGAEAVRAALAWADERFERARIVCMINEENIPSIRLAQRCGFAEYARADYKGERVILFER